MMTMPFGKYNNNDNFWLGFDLPHSRALKGLHAYDVLSHFRTRYGDDSGSINSEGRDILVGLATSLLLQGFSNSAKFLVKESGIELDGPTKKVLNYADRCGQIRLEDRVQTLGETESPADSFLRQLKAESKP